MKIIILGAGQVGTTLAENLCAEHDVTVVDLDQNKLDQLQRKLDIRTVTGQAHYPNTLEDAGADEAEMLIAVTSNDESNIVACQVSYSLFRTPTKIARVRCRELTAHKEIFTPDHIPIDMLINPSDVITQRIRRQIEYPGTQLVLDFADENVKLFTLRATPPSPLIGMKVSELYQDLEETQVTICAIVRNEEAFGVTPDDIIEAHDEVFFVARSKDVSTITSTFLHKEQKYRRIMIAGGGNIGLSLAMEIENDYHVKLIERSDEQSEIAANQLNQAVVLHGDASDTDLLNSENIDEVDLFCALTDDDEANIMSAILAKRLGAKTTAALVNRQTYATYLIERTPDIDVAISPQKITGGVILKHLRKGDMVNVYPLPGSQAEAIEIIVHGDENSSNVIGKTIEQLHFPKAIIAGAVIRGENVHIDFENLNLKNGDHIVFFIAHHNRIKEIEKLFCVAPMFM